jgi:hypothetical protein
MRYEAFRSLADKNLHIIAPEGALQTISAALRDFGPWRKLEAGEILNLKPQYRLSIARTGYALIRVPPIDFKPEWRRHSLTPISLADWKKARVFIDE